MQAKTIEEARKEGKNFARLLGKMLVKAPNQDYEVVADFGSYVAEDVLGYTTASFANAWTKGFIAEWMQAKTTNELSNQELFNQIIALLPKPEEQE